MIQIQIPIPIGIITYDAITNYFGRSDYHFGHSDGFISVRARLEDPDIVIFQFEDPDEALLFKLRFG